MSSIEVAFAASQASCHHDFKIIPTRANRAGAPKQPAENPQAASGNSDPESKTSDALICRVNAKLLFELDRCARFFKLLLNGFSVIFRCAFLNG
jgi:hypothetical protein